MLLTQIKGMIILKNTISNYDKWKENPTSEYKIDQNVVKDTHTQSSYIKEDYISSENIYLKIKNFSYYGFYPFKNLSIDEFVDIMIPNMCSEDCPVIRVCKENNEEINEENTEKACKVCKNAFKEFLLEV